MLRKTMVALCAIASIGMLAPDMALARGGGGGGGGGGHGGGGGGMGGGGRGGGGFGGGFGGHAGGFGGGNFAARGMGGGNFNSFARATPNVAVQGNRFAAGNFAGNRFAHGNFGRPGFHHGFHRGRHFFFAGVGPGFYDDYYDYPDYAYDDYYDNGGCYVVQRRVHTAYGWRVRPVQVCG